MSSNARRPIILPERYRMAAGKTNIPAEIDFKYKWLYGGYTTTVTFTDKILPIENFPFIPGVVKTTLGAYTKKYNGKTTFAIINDMKKDIEEAKNNQARQNVESAAKAVESAKTASRKVDTSAAVEAARQQNKATLAYMLTNFCGYKKTVTATSGLKGSLRAQTTRVGYLGSKKVITPGREQACDALDAAYRTKNQVYPEHPVLLAMINNPTVAGKEINNKKEYNDIYSKGEREHWVIPSRGGTRRKNRK